MSVCREIWSDLVQDSPFVQGGSELPDTPPAPSLENPPKFFSNGCFLGVQGRGAEGGRAAAAASAPPGASDSAGNVSARSARAPAGPALGISGATRCYPVPRRRICAGSGLALLPSWGGWVG